MADKAPIRAARQRIMGLIKTGLEPVKTTAPRDFLAKLGCNAFERTGRAGATASMGSASQWINQGGRP